MLDLLEYIGFFCFFYMINNNNNNNNNNNTTVERQEVSLCVWDPLGQPVKRYQLFFDHLIKISKKEI